MKFLIIFKSDPWPGLTAVEASFQVVYGSRMSLPSDSECPKELEDLMNA